MLKGGGGKTSFHFFQKGGGGETSKPVLTGWYTKFRTHDFPIYDSLSRTVIPTMIWGLLTHVLIHLDWHRTSELSEIFKCTLFRRSTYHKDIMKANWQCFF